MPDALSVELAIMLDAVELGARLLADVKPNSPAERRLHAALRQVVAAAEGLREVLSRES